MVIAYDSAKHEYFFNKKIMTPVTTYLHKFYSEFDSKNIIRASAAKWGVKEKEIADLWEANRDISAEFGTSIHNSLEFWENFKELGARISEARGNDENYALPKHPILKSIILEFEKINTIKGEVLTEKLISDVKNGICGRADRVVILDWDKKICRVGDYKINVESEAKKSSHKAFAPFDHLPNNKISKYQLQMSIYANMLTKSGWTVEGLDVYIYENEWKYYSLEVLQVL